MNKFHSAVNAYVKFKRLIYRSVVITQTEGYFSGDVILGISSSTRRIYHYSRSRATKTGARRLFARRPLMIATADFTSVASRAQPRMLAPRLVAFVLPEIHGARLLASLLTRVSLPRAYILHTLFNFTTSRFNSADGFSTITPAYFASSCCLTVSPIPPPFFFFSLFSPLSLSLSLFFLFLPRSSPFRLSRREKLRQLQGRGAALCAPRQIGNILPRNIATAYRLRLAGIYGATTVYPVVPARY